MKLKKQNKEVKPTEEFEIHDLGALPMPVAKDILKKIKAHEHDKPVFFKLPKAKKYTQKRSQWEKSSTRCPYCGSLLTEDLSGEVVCSNNKLNDIYVYIRETVDQHGVELTERILSKKEHRFLEDFVKGRRLSCDYKRGIDDDYFSIIG